jgi:hypothetical protein
MTRPAYRKLKLVRSGGEVRPAYLVGIVPTADLPAHESSTNEYTCYDRGSIASRGNGTTAAEWADVVRPLRTNAANSSTSDAVGNRSPPAKKFDLTFDQASIRASDGRSPGVDCSSLMARSAGFENAPGAESSTAPSKIKAGSSIFSSSLSANQAIMTQITLSDGAIRIKRINVSPHGTLATAGGKAVLWRTK